MARTYRDPRAFRKGRGHNKIVSAIQSASFIVINPMNGRVISRDGAESWGVGHKRWAKRQVTRFRRRLDRSLEGFDA